MYQLEKNNFMSGNFLAVQCLELSVFTAVVPGWIPGWWTRILYAMQCGKKKKKEKKKTPYQNGKVTVTYKMWVCLAITSIIVLLISVS